MKQSYGLIRLALEFIKFKLKLVKFFNLKLEKAKPIVF